MVAFENDYVNCDVNDLNDFFLSGFHVYYVSKNHDIFLETLIDFYVFCGDNNEGYDVDSLFEKDTDLNIVVGYDFFYFSLNLFRQIKIIHDASESRKIEFN